MLLLFHFLFRKVSFFPWNPQLFIILAYSPFLFFIKSARTALIWIKWIKFVIFTVHRLLWLLIWIIILTFILWRTTWWFSSSILSLWLFSCISILFYVIIKRFVTFTILKFFIFFLSYKIFIFNLFLILFVFQSVKMFIFYIRWFFWILYCWRFRLWFFMRTTCSFDLSLFLFKWRQIWKCNS